MDDDTKETNAKNETDSETTPSGEDASQPDGADQSSVTRAVEATTASDGPAPLVAIMGEIPFAGQGVVRALCDAGLRVRVLCPDEDTDLALRAQLAQSHDASTEGDSRLQTIRGAADNPEDLSALVTDADGLVLLSPVGLSGRLWGSENHRGMVEQALTALKDRASCRFVYLSTLAADPKSGARCIQEALEAEKLIAESNVKAYVLRAAPLMGRGDEICTDIANRAAGALPFVLMWGYGDTTLQPIHVLDLGRCVTRVFSNKSDPMEPGIYTVAGKETISLLELMDMALMRMERFKLKVHIPAFVLRLIALAAGKGRFSERVQLTSTPFFATRNDALAILGPHHGLRTLQQIRDEAMGVK